MSCSKCKKEEKTIYQCDICQKNICNICARITTTEDRCMALSKGRTLKFFCPECEEYLPEYRKCSSLNEKLKLENQELRKQLAKNKSRTTSSPIANNYVIELEEIKKYQLELKQNFTETIKTLVENEIGKLKREIEVLRESNVDLIKLYTQTPSNITKKPPIILNHSKKQNNNKGLSDKSVSPRTQDKESVVSKTPKKTPMKPNQPESTGEDFKEVKSRKQKRRAKIGTGEINEEDNLEVRFEGRQEPKKEEKKIWIFLSKAKDHVTDTMVKKFISKKTKAEEESISVKSIRTYYQVKDNKCFLVGVDQTLKDTVYYEHFWPRGVAFDRFDFRKGQHFLDNPRTRRSNNTNNESTNDEDFLSTMKTP